MTQWAKLCIRIF